MDTQTAINDTKVNLTALKAALKDGPLNVRQLADKMGRSSPWDLEEGLRKLVTTQEMVASLGVSVDFEITMFPARERARYHFPDIVPEVQGENPKRKRREFKTVTGPDGKPVKVKRSSLPDAAKVQKQYWPIVAWGTIIPDLPGTAEVAYDGRHDDDVEWLRELLTAKGFDFLDIKGRMVRGGSGIYISLEKDAPATDAGPVIVDGGDDIVVEPSYDSADNDATVTA